MASPLLSQQCCASCKHYPVEKVMTKAGSIVQDRVAKCQWDINITWPDSVDTRGRHAVGTNYMSPDAGKTCPVWTPRDAGG